MGFPGFASFTRTNYHSKDYGSQHLGCPYFSWSGRLRNTQETENAANIYDQWKNATGAEKTRIFRANRKALEIASKNLTPQ